MTISNELVKESTVCCETVAQFAGWNIGHPLWGDFVLAVKEDSGVWRVLPSKANYWSGVYAMEWEPGCNPEPWLRREGMI